VCEVKGVGHPIYWKRPHLNPSRKIDFEENHLEAITSTFLRQKMAGVVPPLELVVEMSSGVPW
jgi:hypothetical protein